MDAFINGLRHHSASVFFIVLATIIALSPIASNDLIPRSADLVNHLSAIIQAKMALLEGQFPIRVMPYLHSGWRYPFYQFYAPSVNLLAGAIFLFLANPYVVLKLIILLAVIAGGLYLYRLAYWITQSKHAALLASVAYITSPYYLIVLDHLYDFTEAVALGILPIVWFYTLRLFFMRKQLRVFLLTTMSWYLLATIHLVTFFYAGIFLVLLLLFFILQKPVYWRNSFIVAAAIAFSCILAAWYLLPIIMLRHFLCIEMYYGNDVINQNYIVTLGMLLSPIASLIQMSLKPGELTNILLNIHPNIGLPLLLGIGASFFMLLYKHETSSFANEWLRPLLLTSICLFAVIWSATGIWNALPHMLSVGQYSWRLMGQMIGVAALLLALSVAWFFPTTEHSKQIILLGFICIIYSTSSWYVSREIDFVNVDYDYMLRQPDFGFADDAYLANPDTLTKHSLKKQAASMPVMKISVAKKYCHQLKTITQCQFAIASLDRMVQLPVLYYPQLLHVTLNGKKIHYQGMLNKDTLLTAIKIPAGQVNTVKVSFVGFALGNWISRGGFVIFGLLVFCKCLMHYRLVSIRQRELALCVK